MKTLAVTLTTALLLSACTGPAGPLGPPGPAGPPGPPGPPNTAPHRLSALRVTDQTSITLPDTVDVVICDSGGSLTVNLPRSADAGAGRVVTLRAAAGSRILVVARNGELIDRAVLLEIESDEMATLISDGTTRWTVIGSSDL